VTAPPRGPYQYQWRRGRSWPSPSELETARLAAAGLSNAQIAEARGISTATVSSQLSEVYRIVGLGGAGRNARVELARWWANRSPEAAEVTR